MTGVDPAQRKERASGSLHEQRSGDQDHDGIPNRYDTDRNGDGIPNKFDRAHANPHR